MFSSIERLWSLAGISLLDWILIKNQFFSGGIHHKGKLTKTNERFVRSEIQDDNSSIVAIVNND